MWGRWRGRWILGCIGTGCRSKSVFRRRFVDAIDDNNIHGAFPRLQPEAELFLQGDADVGRASDISLRRGTFIGEGQCEIVFCG